MKLSVESGCLPGIFSPPSNPGDLGRGPIPQGLREIGYVERQNLVIAAENHYDRLAALTTGGDEIGS